MNTHADAAASPRSGYFAATVLAPAVVLGFAAAVATWVVWFLTHTPALRLPPAVAGPVLLLVQAGVIAWLGRGVPGAGRWRVGVLAGLIAAGINLLILGSKIVQPAVDAAGQPAPQPGLGGLVPGAGMIIVGFMVASAAVGLIGAVVAGFLAKGPGETQPASYWLGRFSVVACIAIVPLLTLGGLVTSTASGLAVPDWPGTYGANMFLYPIGLMAEPRIYFEHTHRLFGTLVGLTTLTLLVFTLVVDRRRWAKIVAFVLFLAVALQGWMGGARVYEQSQMLAVLHGVFAQLFFAGTVAFAAALSPGFARADTPALTGRGRGLGLWLLASLAVQLLMGALYRHLGSTHPLWTHVGFSLVVVTLAVLSGSWWIGAARANAGDPLLARLRRLGAGLHASVGIQFLLGWVALLAVLTNGSASRGIPKADQLATAQAVPVWEATVRTAHQANGALLLALATLACVWAWRLVGPRTNEQKLPASVQ
jgi:cytochrome c oxidase assembly protein subunit 15